MTDAPTPPASPVPANPVPASPVPAGPVPGADALEAPYRLLSWLPALLAALLAFGWLAWSVWRTAWLCDDAYITFRTVENLLAGDGLRWNVAERVQTFTHPLWLFCLLGARVLVGDIYYATLGLCFVVCGLAAFVLMRIARRPAVVFGLLLALAGSRAFVCFSTSGLENPLTFLLLAVFVACWSDDRPTSQPEQRLGRHLTRRLTWLALVAALLAVNRLDTVLLTGPAMLAAAWRLRWVAWLRPCLLGGLPLFAWFVFAFVYYGSLLPITAFAKATAVGLGPGVLAAEGVRYLLDVVTRDPGTALVLVAMLVLGLCRRPAFAVTPLVLGPLLYLAYTVKIGGDFMAGRFVTPPLVLLLAIGGRLMRDRPRLAALLGAATTVLLFVPDTPPQLFPLDVRPPDNANGSISDERAHYCLGLGLNSPKRGTPRYEMPQFGIVTATMRQNNFARTVFSVEGWIGQVGFNSGALVHLVDPWLLDPLLMRLPLRDPQRWRIGHFSRTVPDGYLETLASGTNRIEHEGLHAFYDHLQLVVRGDLWSWERLRTAFLLQIGAYDDLLARYVAEEYRNPKLRTVAASELPRATPPQQWWFTTPSRLIGEGGLLIRFDGPQRGTVLQLGLDARDLYRFVFLRGSTELAASELETPNVPYLALDTHAVPVPAAAAGFDALRIERGKRGGAPTALPDVGFSGDAVWAISSLRVE